MLAVDAGATSEFTNTCRVIKATDTAPIECYRLLNTDGTIINEEDDPGTYELMPLGGSTGRGESR